MRTSLSPRLLRYYPVYPSCKYIRVPGISYSRRKTGYANEGILACVPVLQIRDILFQTIEGVRSDCQNNIERSLLLVGLFHYKPRYYINMAFGCYSPLVLSLTLFTSGGVFLLFIFFRARFTVFSSVCHIPCGREGGLDSLFPLFFFFSPLFVFRFVVFFSFLIFLLFPLISLFHRIVCRGCRIEYDDIASHLPLLCVYCILYLVQGTWYVATYF